MEKLEERLVMHMFFFEAFQERFGAGAVMGP